MDAATMIGTNIVSILAGWFLRPYFVKRSEQQAEYNAIRKNLDTIRLKVEVTEKAAVQIKEDLAHEKWWEREDRVLRRTKIEELVTAAIQTLQPATDLLLTNRALDEYAKLGPWFRALTIATLYFPTLRDDAHELTQAGLKLITVALPLRDYDQAHPGGGAGSAEGRAALLAAYQDASKNVYTRAMTVVTKSVPIMDAILAKPESILAAKS